MIKEGGRSFPGRCASAPFRIMEQLSFIEEEETEVTENAERSAEDQREFEEWKEKKREAKARFTAMQSLPYKVKVKRAELRAIEFMEEMDKRDCHAHVSVGGLDSITLLLFLRHVGIDVPAISVSNKCCYYLKEKPCDDWAREHNSWPFLGMMASEGGQREEALVDHGCNYYGKTVMRSAPFAPFLRQDILQLALDLNVPVPEIYGTIEKKTDGTLYTTKAQRTGCSMCGFGCTSAVLIRQLVNVMAGGEYWIT